MYQNPSYSVSAASLQSTIAKYIIRIYTLDRKIQKAFATRPQLLEALTKAKLYGFHGSKLLLADDGCEICDDEAFLYYIEQNAKFMVANNSAQWMDLPM